MALSLRRNVRTKIDDFGEKLNSAWARTDEIFAIVATNALAATPIV